MPETEVIPVGEGVTLRVTRDPRFKTMRLSVHFFLPMAEETAAVYGILPGLVTRATREYPDFRALNLRLSQLYGASLSAYVRKIGGFQCLSFGIGSIAERYAFGGEPLLAELSELLWSALFTPLCDEAGLFPEENFEQERRQLLEWKDSEYNDKGAYARRRCEELLFEGGPAALDRYGSREQIEALEREVLMDAWREVLARARVEISVLGDCRPNLARLTERFRGIGRAGELAPLPYEEPGTPRRREESQPVTQSKLCMGFRVDAKPEERLVMQLMSAVLGGIPSSKLFQNVREKMGLCYYCSSSLSVLNRSMFIESGVEAGNMEAAQKAILRQVEHLQAGKLEEDELTAAKLALRNSFRSMGDSLSAMENRQVTAGFFPAEESPERDAQRVMELSARQVIEAAGRLRLGAIYCLRGREGEEA